VTLYLVDKSAWVWRQQDPVARADFDGILAEHSVATCHVTMLEMLYSARNPAEYEKLRFRLLRMKQLPDRKDPSYGEVLAQVLDRAMDVQRLLMEKGQKRRPVQDLIIAACAEQAGATVLHVDKDYPIIATVTGQAERRLVTTPGTAG
jgi:predicted nucleic acid-binding protein